MKNRFLLFVVCQCLVVFGFAQETNAKPTKEETMKWIADKIYGTRSGGYSEMYYGNGLLSCKSSTGMYYEINLHNVTSIDTGLSFRNTENVTYFVNEKVDKKGDMVYIRRLLLKGGVLVKKYVFVSGAKSYYSDSQNSVNLLAARAYNDNKAEPISDMFLVEGLYERMIKALKVLIEYNTAPQKGEKF